MKLLPALLLLGGAAVQAQKPNIVYLLVDDWGAGDVDMCPEDLPLDHCPFRPTNKARRAHLHTPRIRQMAEEGQILSNFYSPRAICTPSRAGMLSGRDPSRYGMVDNIYRIILSSNQRAGMPTSEKSVAKYMKELGYNTGYTGKWHLGMTDGTNPTAFTPLNHGFDWVKFFIEGSNGESCKLGSLNPPGDNNIYHMCSFDHIQDCDSTTGTCEVVEQPIRWENVTNRHLRTFKEFVDTHKDKAEPFFYWHAFTSVHVPWIPSRFFISDPVMKYWTDFVSEMDWAVGYILKYLKEHAPNTMVVLSSDNGPYKESASSYCPSECRWMTPEAERAGKPEQSGCSPCDASISSQSAANNIGGKGNTWEGGQRVPSLVWWPEKIPAGKINPIVASGLDLLPTFVSLGGGTLDPNTVYDGRDISAHLMKADVKPDDEPEGTFVYMCGNFVQAVRINRHKILYRTQKFVGQLPTDKTPPNLCAQSGDCCPESTTRLCSCVEPFVTVHRQPVVIDLVDNPREDLSKALTGSNVAKLISDANAIAKERLASALEDRNVAPHYFDANDIENMTATLSALPMFQYTDVCTDLGVDDLGNNSPFGPYLCDGDTPGQYEWFPKLTPKGCGYLPEKCQKSVLPGQTESFYEFENCAIDGPGYQGPKCAARLPCCKQEGYLGPFEYIKPTTSEGWDGEIEQCGCFNNYANSYFPEDDDMKQSVCDWQKDVYTYLNNTDQLYFFKGFCKPDYCENEKYDKVPNNTILCNTIKQWGMSNVPTGMIFNQAYPDTQYNSSLRYLNQDEPPPMLTNKPTTKPTSTPTSSKTAKDTKDTKKN